MIPLVNLKRQYQSIKPEIDQAIQAVIDDCAFVEGKYCQQFEANFAKFCDKEFCVGCSNGTTAIELALAAYKIGPGDEVILPSHTFIATAEVVSNVGATPVFAEIDPKTYTIDPADVGKRITPKTKAIIPVHLYGHMADMAALSSIANQHNLLIIEDCAQAHGSEYKGKRAPFGEIGTFSFYPGKNLGAYGDAGAVVTSNPEVANYIRTRLNHGRNKGEKYTHHHIGTNYRMDGLQGAILDVKLRYLPDWTEKRRKAATLYDSLLKDKPDLTLPYECPDVRHVYHLYVIRTAQREALFKKLKEQGIECQIHYPIPLHLQPAYQNLGYKPGDFPITEQICQEILSLPLCSDIKDEEISLVASQL